MSTDIAQREEHAVSTRSVTTEVATSRAAQEVQARMAIAKRFPRDEKLAYSRLMTSCKRKGLAYVLLFEIREISQQLIDGSACR